MNFANVRNNVIIDFNCLYLDEDIKRIEVTDEIFEAYLDDKDKVIYQDGKVILNPNWEEIKKQQERERINMLSLTKREVFLALYKAKGLTPEQLRSKITDTEALIEFDYANDYYRGNPLIDKIGTMLGYTQDDLDYLFENKELPE